MRDRITLPVSGRRWATLNSSGVTHAFTDGSTAYRWCWPDIELRQRNADAAGGRLGHDAYQRAFDAGYSLTLDGAVELAEP